MSPKHSVSGLRRTVSVDEPFIYSCWAFDVVSASLYRIITAVL